MALIPLLSHKSQLNLIGAWHLVYYIPKNGDETDLSGYLLGFKNGHPISINKWKTWVADEISQLNIRLDLVVRAVGSQELVPGNKPGLDTLGNAISTIKGCTYNPKILNKIRIFPALHTIPNAIDRSAAINGSYEVVDLSIDYSNKNILIIDDVTTSKSTITEILRALRKEWPTANYYFFCLGKTEYLTNLNKNIEQSYF